MVGTTSPEFLAGCKIALSEAAAIGQSESPLLGVVWVTSLLRATSESGQTRKLAWASQKVCSRPTGDIRAFPI